MVGAEQLRDGLIGPDFGVVTACMPLRKRPGAVGGSALMVPMPRLADWVDLDTTDRAATGFGSTLAAMRGSASGELVERYSAAFVPDAHGTGVEGELRRWVPFTAEQYAQPGFEYADPAGVAEIAWMRAWDLVTRTHVPVPSDLVLLRCTSSEQWCTITSNGLAAGRSLGAATRAACLELVERDAFVRAWYGAASCPTVTLEALVGSETGERALGEELVRVARRLRRAGVDVTFVRLESAVGAPVVLACARSAQVGLAVGCAAKPDPARAVRAALTEVVQTYDWALSMVSGEVDDVVDDLQEHVAFHAPPERAHLSAFLDSGPSVLPEAFLDGASWTLADLVDACSAAGWSLLVADATSPDVRAAGWHVVRALSPEAATLDTGPIHEAQHERLAHRIPHPFP